VRTLRSICLPSQAPRAPVADWLPVSSLSNSTIALMCCAAGEWQSQDGGSPVNGELRTVAAQ
jgi:hypothetical protein